MFIGVWAINGIFVPGGCMYTIGIGFVFDVCNISVCHLFNGCVE